MATDITPQATEGEIRLLQQARVRHINPLLQQAQHDKDNPTIYNENGTYINFDPSANTLTVINNRAPNQTEAERQWQELGVARDFTVWQKILWQAYEAGQSESPEQQQRKESLMALTRSSLVTLKRAFDENKPPLNSAQMKKFKEEVKHWRYQYEQEACRIFADPKCEKYFAQAQAHDYCGYAKYCVATCVEGQLRELDVETHTGTDAHDKSKAECPSNGRACALGQYKGDEFVRLKHKTYSLASMTRKLPDDEMAKLIMAEKERRKNEQGPEANITDAQLKENVKVNAIITNFKAAMADGIRHGVHQIRQEDGKNVIDVHRILLTTSAMVGKLDLGGESKPCHLERKAFQKMKEEGGVIITLDSDIGTREYHVKPHFLNLPVNSHSSMAPVTSDDIKELEAFHDTLIALLSQQKEFLAAHPKFIEELNAAKNNCYRPLSSLLKGKHQREDQSHESNNAEEMKDKAYLNFWSPAVTNEYLSLCQRHEVLNLLIGCKSGNDRTESVKLLATYVDRLSLLTASSGNTRGESWAEPKLEFERMPYTFKAFDKIKKNEDQSLAAQQDSADTGPTGLEPSSPSDGAISAQPSQTSLSEEKTQEHPPFSLATLLVGNKGKDARHIRFNLKKEQGHSFKAFIEQILAQLRTVATKLQQCLQGLSGQATHAEYLELPPPSARNSHASSVSTEPSENSRTPSCHSLKKTSAPKKGTKGTTSHPK